MINPTLLVRKTYSNSSNKFIPVPNYHEESHETYECGCRQEQLVYLLSY